MEKRRGLSLGPPSKITKPFESKIVEFDGTLNERKNNNNITESKLDFSKIKPLSDEDYDVEFENIDSKLNEDFIKIKTYIEHSSNESIDNIRLDNQFFNKSLVDLIMPPNTYDFKNDFSRPHRIRVIGEGPRDYQTSKSDYPIKMSKFFQNIYEKKLQNDSVNSSRHTPHRIHHQGEEPLTTNTTLNEQPSIPITPNPQLTTIGTASTVPDSSKIDELKAAKNLIVVEPHVDEKVQESLVNISTVKSEVMEITHPVNSTKPQPLVAPAPTKTYTFSNPIIFNVEVYEKDHDTAETYFYYFSKPKHVFDVDDEEVDDRRKYNFAQPLMF